MPTPFRPCQPDQILLRPPSLRDGLAEGHFAHHHSDLVDALDLTAFYAPYEGDGRRNTPCELGMMVKILLYGYATGVFSSRRIVQRLEEDIACNGLSAGRSEFCVRIGRLDLKSSMVYIARQLSDGVDSDIILNWRRTPAPQKNFRM